MPVAMAVGLGPGHIVLDGDPAPPKGEYSSPPHFSAHVLGPNGWLVDQDATYESRCPLGMKVGLGPGHIGLNGDPAPPKGHSPHFLLSTCT